MASPETYLAHSKSLAKKIKSGQLEADRNFLMEHLGNSYSESLKEKIVAFALKLSQDDDVSVSKSKNKDFQQEIIVMAKKALFVHGFNSGSDSSTGAQVKKYLEEGHYYGEKYEVHVLDFDMLNPKETIGRIWNASKSNEYSLIVGHSLGGFYVLASQFDIQKIVINPCMFPSVEIPKLDDNHVVTPQLIEKWKQLEGEIYCQIDPETKELISGVFGESDPLFSYYEKFQSVYGKERAVKVPGEHKFTDEQIKAALDAGFYGTRPIPGSCAPMSFEGSDEYDDEAFIKALKK